YFYFIMNVILESPTGLAESIMITVAPFIIKDLIVTVVVVLFAHTLVRRGITPQTYNKTLPHFSEEVFLILLNTVFLKPVCECFKLNISVLNNFVIYCDEWVE